MKTGTKIALGLGGLFAGWVIYEVYTMSVKERALAESITKNPQLSAPSINSMQTSGASSQPTIAKRKGDLQVTVALRASGVEKMFANKNDLIRDILKAAKSIGAQLPTECPGAPPLQGEPRVELQDSSTGFNAIITWPAIWRGTETGPVKAIVRDCITRLVKASDPQISERLVSLTARRMNAYA